MLKKDIVFLAVIAERKEKQELIDELFKMEAKVFDVIYGHGSVQKNDVLKAFGLVVEQNKVVITCLISKENSYEALDMLNTKFSFDKPNTGIAFTIPVEEIKY